MGGVTPAGQNLGFTTIKASVLPYGAYVTTDDFISLVGIDPIVTETLETLGEQAGETLDIVARDVVCAGTNVLYLTPGAVVRSDVAEGITLMAEPFAVCVRLWPVTALTPYLGAMWALFTLMLPMI